MTSVGDHVHPVSAPWVDLVVDQVAEQDWDSAWLAAHDEATGEKVYLAADETTPDLAKAVQ